MKQLKISKAREHEVGKVLKINLIFCDILMKDAISKEIKQVTICYLRRENRIYEYIVGGTDVESFQRMTFHH